MPGSAATRRPRAGRRPRRRYEAVHAGDGSPAVVSGDPADAVRAALSRQLRVGHCFSAHGGALACPEAGCAFVVAVDVDVDGAVVAECLADAARALILDVREAAVDAGNGPCDGTKCWARS